MDDFATGYLAGQDSGGGGGNNGGFWGGDGWWAIIIFAMIFGWGNGGWGGGNSSGRNEQGACLLPGKLLLSFAQQFQHSFALFIGHAIQCSQQSLFFSTESYAIRNGWRFFFKIKQFVYRYTEIFRNHNKNKILRRIFSYFPLRNSGFC